MNQDELMQQLQTAVKAYQANNLDMAETILKQILAVNSKEPSALHLLGCIHKDRGQLQEAVDLIQASIREDATNPIPLLNLGKILAVAGQHENAAVVLQESLKRSQKIPETWFCFGNALREIEKIEEAKHAYRNALQLYPAHAGAASNLGALLIDDVELEEAEQLFLKAVEQAPNNVNLRINYGKLLSEKDQHAAAIVQYQIALPLAPHSPELHYNFANSLKELRGFEEAITNYRKAIEVKPGFVAALSELASELVKRDEFEEAISLYKRALVEDPEHVNSSSGLGLCFLKSDRLEEGIEYYLNLLVTSPNNTDALFFLFEALRGELQGKLKQDFSYSMNFLKKCLGLMGVSSFAAFGDSHVQLFEGYEEINVNHVGASTAYNLAEEDSSTGGRRKVLNRIARMDPKVEAVLLCFGEVDIRANVIKYCYQRGLSIQECVDGIVERYISFAREIASRGFKILIYGGYGAGSDRNSVGSDRERNFAAKCLNTSLFARCEEYGFVYFSLHDALLNEESLETDSSFLSDGFHLNNDDLLAKVQVQTLLFERACKSAQSIFGKRKHQSPRNLVLGNVGVSNSLKVGSLESGCLSWEAVIDSLQSIVFDLGSFLRFDAISLELEADLDADRMNLMLDGRFLEVNVFRESSYRWHLRPVDQSVPFIGRYPMLKASSDVLLSIKGFSVKKLSLV